MSEETELVPVEDNRLKELVTQSELDSTKAAVLLENFQDYFTVASEWGIRAKAIVVTDISQKDDMQMARTGRLLLREKRIKIEKTRKELKEQSLREGKAIDGIANVLKALIVPIEEYLGEQEKFAENLATAEAARVLAELEAKAEADRLAKEEAERVEQERIRVENARLKVEAEKAEAERIAREQALEAERAKVATEKAKAEKEAEDKRLAREAEIEAERAKVATEKAKAEKEAEDKRLAREAEIEAERAKVVAKREAEKAQAAREVRLAQQKAADKIAEAKLEVERANAKATKAKAKRKAEDEARKAAEIECPFCHKTFIPE